MYDLIIIGAGPAGLTAALYAGRALLKTLMLEKMSVGGRILMSETIENFPGFVGDVSTQNLIANMQKQVSALNVRIESTEALELDPESLKVKTDSGEFSAKSIIIATGAKPRKLNVSGEERLTGRGVSYCATCDAPFYKEKDVVVVGGGNAVAEEAIYLTRFAKTVTIVHRRNELRASGILQEKLKENPKIKFALSKIIKEIVGDKLLESLKLEDVVTKKESNLLCSGVFIYIGNDPETGFLKKILKMDETGFIETAEDMSTSVEGIFACGDCRKKSLYQVVTACGDGAIAAESAYKYVAIKR